MSTEKQMRGLKHLDKRLGGLTVGEVLNTWRLSEEMTLKEFGKKIGISVSNLCDIEKGRKGVSPKKAQQIAKAIGVPPALLIRLAVEEELKTLGLRYKVELIPAAA